MDARTREIQSRKNPRLSINIIPGHFATSHSHVNYYIDMTSMKCYHLMAKEAAAELATNFTSTPIDTIVCLDGCEIVGAFLARAVCNTSLAGINRNENIAVITPEINPSNQMLFRDNVQKMIWNKRVLLLVASVTTGKTINRALECIQYYGGKTAGICAIFSAVDKVRDTPITSLFDTQDLPDYKIYHSSDCPLCQAGAKMDAIINSYGYSKL
ncbi:MAG: orotate phosphoribosyltransferase [Oscillospiraceae bacterium]|nr:orotate phosphoribosyltransferase [Oscillospiraceae bacterium]